MKKITSAIFLIFLITIILFGNALWYFYGGYNFRSHQSYWMRELLSSSYKIVVYLLPALLLLWSLRKQSRKIHRHDFWWPFTILFTIFLLIAKTQFTQYHSQSPTATLLTYGYVLIINSMVEEYVFRWILLSKFSQSFSFRTANILQAWCFGLVHLPFYVRMGRSWISLIIGLWWVTLLWFRRWYVKKETKWLFYPALLHSVWNGVLIFF